MPPDALPRTRRRDLQDLRNLSRMPFVSFLRKQAAPKVPRADTQKRQPARYPTLAAFTSLQTWTWITEYLRYRIGRKHRFQTYDCADDNGVYRLEGSGDEIRIALAGDWASGTDEAACVATQIEAFAPDYAIHLGDVYYVGDPREVGENFLGHENPSNLYKPCKWPKGSRGTFALNGNHEMYARGFGYFDAMLPTLGLAGSPRGQRASYFCLENEHWRVIALDTGYNSVGIPILENLWQPDCALRPEQIDWLRTAVCPREADPRGIVILTHHQYVSRFDDCFPVPARQLAEFFARPVLWLWGHEHRLAIYKEARIGAGIRAFGRCIGHGGMPVEPPPQKPLNDYAIEFTDTRPYSNDENLMLCYNGFARMTLRGNELTLEYADLCGRGVFTETWAVAHGTLTRCSAQALV